MKGWKEEGWDTYSFFPRLKTRRNYERNVGHEPKSKLGPAHHERT